MNRAHFNNYIKSADFRILFNELGWDNVRNTQYDTSISIDESDFDLKAIAHKSGFLVYVCKVDMIPQNALCRKIDMKLRRYSNDYILIFAQQNSEHHLWMTPVKTIEKRNLVTIEYTEAAKAEFLFSKLDSVSFEIDEQVTIVDVTTRIHNAFEVNSGKITKEFYAGFKKQHTSFAGFIKGINIDGDKQWYASVMLNRLMFCYFIQKKGFLNFDVDYLRNKLEWTKQQRGDDQFFSSFYKGFLCVLFHGGLNNPTHNREFEAIYGRIPYLNGGMFDEHQLEKQYGGIDIADEAFEELFGFFDKWHWHLDTRITATGKDINPDVLGYIFEQYINDRAQMGVYYTKEDITEYIGKNCIIPFLMDEVAKTSSKNHFTPGGFVWETLRNSGDTYIYDAVKKGTELKDIPDEIAIGLDTMLPNLLERRKDWNKPTPEDYALPTEIWRETIERRNRYFELLTKIREGQITQINDFITYNLDIRWFVEDLLTKTDDHRFVLHFYKALQSITILDPTCGSGAFLFAALNILEPLYEICISRMQEFNGKNANLFKDQLDEIEKKYRSNIQYFIYKSIILRNLYGVDIMHEATEIARLRLFLKMVAVVDVDRRAENLGLDPLPDIDFNIRCGNTLIGYATEEELDKALAYGDMFANQEFKRTIEDEMQKVATAYKEFKQIQFTQHENVTKFKSAKNELADRLKELNAALNQQLYKSTTTYSESHGGLTYDKWLESHQPFHWIAEFYQIIKGNGGFDVIIGNPPYVEISKNKITYSLKNNYKDLYAYILERVLLISKSQNSLGFIIPVSFNSTPGFHPLFKKYFQSSLYISCYADTADMFSGITKRLSIVIKTNGYKNLYVTSYIKEKNQMQYRLSRNPYISLESENYFLNNIPPKISFVIEKDILNKYNLSINNMLSAYFSGNGQKIYFTRSIRNFRPFYTFIPYHKEYDNTLKIPSELKSMSFASSLKNHINVFLNSNLMFLLLNYYTDIRNVNTGFVESVSIAKNILIDKDLPSMNDILMEDYQRHKIERFNKTNKCYESYYYPVRSKLIIDEIDKVLAKHYGFTEEELDFIINYDIKYRMGDELNDDN